MRAIAEQIQSGIEGLYDPATGLYFAASYHCRQPDVWGSALAVYCQAAGDRTDQVAQALVDIYDRIVWRGQVRHLPTPMLWEKRLSEAREFRRDFKSGKFYAYGQGTRYWSDHEPNTYQNGAYSPHPVGWFTEALARVNRPLAEKNTAQSSRVFPTRRNLGMLTPLRPSQRAGLYSFCGYASSGLSCTAVNPP